MADKYYVGDRGETVRLLQKALNEKLQYRLPTDGVYGRVTESAVREYQRRNNLPQTGAYDPATQASLQRYIDLRFLDTKDLERMAVEKNLPAAMLKAIRYVEGKSDGFLPDGRCLILFERHKFYKYLGLAKGSAYASQVARTDPDICNAKAGGYQGNSAEHDRLERAKKYDRDAALMSASWGMYQIMGFNYRSAGYNDLNTFIGEMMASEDYHMKAVINFIYNNPNLLNAVKNKDCARTAFYFYGSGYTKYNYDVRLQEALRKFGG